MRLKKYNGNKMTVRGCDVRKISIEYGFNIQSQRQKSNIPAKESIVSSGRTTWIHVGRMKKKYVGREK